MVTTLLLCCLFFSVMVHFTHAEQPTINVNALGGQLGFLGDYAGLSPFQSTSQYISSSSMVMSSSSTDLITFSQFANINGNITTYCQLSGTNQYILAGEFTTINGTQYNSIVQLDASTRQLLPLQQGLNGAVKSLLCANQSTVYVGGDFTAPVGANVTAFGDGHVAIWTTNEQQWIPVPWKGLNGPVYSMIQLQDSILFAGKFDSTGDGQFMNQNTSQSINLASSATISGGNSALSGNNTDPSSVICSQSPWLLEDGVPGYWQAGFASSVQPSVFRISNTHLTTQSTNEFNIISLGSNQYFQLSYTDPVTNQNTTCSESCFLSNNTALPYQDFTVTSPVTTNGIRIYINSWNGIGGGLGGVEILTSDVSLTPTINTNNNSPGCANATPTSSATTSGGNWTQVYSYSSRQTYPVSSFPATQLANNSVSATYQPYISSQGIYNVYITTPGCVGTSTCDQRTQVMYTINLTPGTTSSWFLDQNTYSDQRILIYSGTIAASTVGSFQPSIVMNVASNATASTSSTVSVIADSIEFIRNSTSSALSSVLNYFPANNSYTALSQQLPIGSTVYTLQQANNVVYMGGDFALNGSFSNIVSFDFNKSTLVPLTNGGGVNGRVTSSYLSKTQLFVGGLFNDTALDIKNVAMFDIQAYTWNNLKGGVNDQVSYLYGGASDNSVHFSGPFTSLVSNNQLTFNNAQWNLTNQDWIQPTAFISGPVSNQFDDGNGNTLYLGSIQAAQSYRANDVATLSPESWRSSITALDPNATVNSAVFHDTNTLVLAGRFNLNNTQYHLVIYDGSNWTGLLSNLQGSITSLYTLQNQLFIGGQFNGTTSGPGSNAITSFTVYDLQNKVFQDVQGLTTTNNEQPGQVNVIVPQPNGKYIFVAGNFSLAGLLNCNSICMLDTSTRQWSQLNQGISGNIKDMSVSVELSVTVVGTLSVNGANTVLAVLDNIDSGSWRSVSVTTANLASIDSFLSNGGDSGEAVLAGNNSNGQVYLATWDGKDQFTQIDTSKLGPATDIQHISYVPISSSPSANRFPSDTNSMLMALGNLNILNVGTCSAALYDGSTWFPYILTSSPNATPGTIHQAFTVTECCTLDQIHHYMSVPAVILVSIAISLGIIFFLIALAFIYLFFKRKNNVKYYSDPMKEWKPKYRPHSLLAMLDAANLHGLNGEEEDSGLMVGAAAGAAASGGGGGGGGAGAGASSKREDVGYSTAYDGRGNNSLDISDSSRLRSSGYSGSVPVVSPGGASPTAVTAMPFSFLMAAALKNSSSSIVASEETPKVYYAKFPFEAKEFGELAFDAHVPIVVTDTSDNVWWMGYKDDGYDKPVSGLFPSNYVSKAKPF